MKSTSKAFTFIEVIFVILILGILVVAAIPKLVENDAKKSNARQSQPTKQTQPTNKGTTWN